MTETISDYEGFDFGRLWEGRHRVTTVERDILGRALRGADTRRILEVGSGFGRLTGELLALAPEVVASDFDVASLASLRTPPAGPAPTLRVAANVYHLPFVDGAFSAATMIRVHHHLGDPAAALRELARVLTPGGTAVVSHVPRPTLGTLANDIERATRRRPPGPFRSVTFSGAPVVALPPEPFPVFVRPRETFATDARSGGFEVETEFGTGFEEYRFLRALPASFYVSLGERLGRAPGFPTRFVRLRRGPAGAGSWPVLASILACPRCREPLGPPSGDPIECLRCGYLGRSGNGVLDLRFLPEDSVRLGPRGGSSAAK